MTRPNIISKIREILAKVAPHAEVILYGSEARGDAREDSDIDLLILEDVEKISYGRLTEITTPLYDLALDSGVEISPMVLTRNQWFNRPFKTPFFCNVQNEGIRL